MKKLSIDISKIAHPLLFVLGAIVGTGTYVLFPSALYLLIGIAALIYSILLFQRVCKVNVQSNVIILLYIAFLLLNFTRDMGNDVASRLYVNFALAICAYLIVGQILHVLADGGVPRFLPLLCLVIIAGAILLQLNGYIASRRDGEVMEGMDEGLLLRPGGFMNPNMSAALSLIWLYCALESRGKNSYWLKSASVALCLFVVSLTQSRAAMLFLAFYCLCKLFEGGVKRVPYYVIPVTCVAIALLFYSDSSALEEIYNSFFQRFQGDGSSTERYQVLQTALATFADRPLIGHGMRVMTGSFGVSTHNEVVEWLANFGIIGFFVMLMVFFRFYYVGSLKFLFLCILPTFLFSHNFFETTSFQVALAYGYFVATRRAPAKGGGARITKMRPEPITAYGGVALGIRTASRLTAWQRT